MVQALGTDGPVDLFLASLWAVGRTVWIPLTVLTLGLLSLRLLVAMAQGDWLAVRSDPRIVIYPPAAALVLAAWYLELRAKRRKGQG